MQPETRTPTPDRAPAASRVPDGIDELSPAEIAARLSWARAQGHPRYPWPDVPLDHWWKAMHEIERTTRAVLAGETGVELATTSASGARAIGIAAFTSGLGPLLGLWHEARTVRTDEGTGAVLAAHLHHGRVRARTFRSALTDALQLLARSGIRATLLKSTHTAWVYYPEPGARAAADLDLLVRPADVERAEAAFDGAGYELTHRQSRQRRSTWAPPQASQRLRSIDLTHAENPWAIDLHGSLDRDFYGVRRVDLGLPARDAVTPFPTGAIDALVLTPAFLAAYLALHASEELHNFQLIRLVELILVVRREFGTDEGGFQELHGLLERCGGLRYVYPAVTLVEQLAPATFHETFVRAVERAATPRMRRTLARLTPGTVLHFDRAPMDERFIWSDGPLGDLRRALRFAWPSDGGLREVLGIYANRWRRVRRGRISLNTRTTSGEPHYLMHLATLGKTHLHPKGRAATEELLSLLDARPGERILEIGCGTGGTMIRLVSHVSVQLDGVDVLPTMLRVARRRLRIAGLGRWTRVIRALAHALPCSSLSYDRVYAESVFGFQPAEAAERMLSEVFRVLKPGGLFVINDAIWRPEVPAHTAAAIHDEGVRDFGSAQASPQRWSEREWSAVLDATGFRLVRSERTGGKAGAIRARAGFSPPSTTFGRRARAFLTSPLVTAWHQLTGYLHPVHAGMAIRYRRRLRAHRRDREYIESRTFVLEKPEAGHARSAQTP